VLEQRRNQRFELRLPFEIVRAGANAKSIGETRNVSSTGVLFKSEASVEIGQPIEYLITFPKTPGSRAVVRLKCVGKVVRGADEEVFAATLERYEFLRAGA
jgi:hypothetical protein